MPVITNKTKEILSHYASDNPGTLNSLARILSHGKLGGSGKMIIYPVDQGFEHGPARSFAKNFPSYDPHYHWQLAIDAGLNAFAAPLGMIEAGAAQFAGQIPTILKLNSANSLHPQADTPMQAVNASIEDALRLGCSAVGFTIYPGSHADYDMIEQLQTLALEAKAAGLAVVVWSYARGADISKKGETALDVIAYSAHIAALIGAHIIKVKLPTAELEQAEAAKAYKSNNISIAELAERVAHVKQCCFAGRRLVVFSGGAAKEADSVYQEVEAIRDGGGDGSIIGRNVFQRPREEALGMLSKIISIYQ